MKKVLFSTFLGIFAIGLVTKAHLRLWEYASAYYLSAATNWTSEFHVTSANASTLRNELIEYAFNGKGLPTSDAITVVPSFRGLMHGVDTNDLTDQPAVDLYSYTVADDDGWDWGYHMYHIKTPKGNANRLFLLHRGHGSEGSAGYLAFMNRALSYGYDVLFCAMPKADPDVDGDNTIETGHPYTDNHESLFVDGLDKEGYSPFHLFFESQLVALNYILHNYNYADIFATGLSGGGWTVAWLAAMDPRLTKTFCVRGLLPRSFKVPPQIPAGKEPDYEQGGNGAGAQAKCGPRVYDFYTNHSYIDIALLTTTGGREFHYVGHTQDPSVIVSSGRTYELWETRAQTIAESLGGLYKLFLSTASGEEPHTYQPTEMNYIFGQLGDLIP